MLFIKVRETWEGQVSGTESKCLKCKMPGRHPSGNVKEVLPNRVGVSHLPGHHCVNMAYFGKLKSNGHHFLGDSLIHLVNSISLVYWLNVTLTHQDCSSLSGPTHKVHCNKRSSQSSDKEYLAGRLLQKAEGMEVPNP